MAYFKMLDGNGACVKAMVDAGIQVVSAYPITPQSTIAEKLSEEVVNGNLDAEYIRVESEHSAMSAAIGAQLTGLRTGTATASVGLALMHEVVNVASGCRVPIVMPVINRSLASPWSLWCDHQDSMAERDSGWLQLYCENVQDVYDTMICAYKIGEDERVQLPVMVCVDGFFLSHSMQKLSLPKQEEVRAFVGPYIPKNLVLDTQDPVVINCLTGSNDNEEMRYQVSVGFEQAASVMDEVFGEYEDRFGRKLARVEGYLTDDADSLIISMGSAAGTAKAAVNELRKEGKKVGALRIRSYRPFPTALLREMTGNVSKIAVLDRTGNYGGVGTPLWTDVKAALGDRPLIKNYVAGLAGRDINIQTIKDIFNDLDTANRDDMTLWIDCDRENAMKIREVQRYV